MRVDTSVQDGRERVILDRQDHEDLIDARDHAIAMRHSAGGEGVRSVEDMAAYLESATPLAFWRKRAGKTQAELAREAGVSQPFLAQLEIGRRTGTVAVPARLAQALGIRIDDLVETG